MVIRWPDWRWFGDWCLGASFFFWLVVAGLCVVVGGGGCCWFGREIETDWRDRDKRREDREMLFLYYFIEWHIKIKTGRQDELRNELIK